MNDMHARRESDEEEREESIQERLIPTKTGAAFLE
jgi:hypothetical protein